MKAPDHYIQIHGTVFTGWPATAIIILIILSFVVLGFWLVRSGS